MYNNALQWLTEEKKSNGGTDGYEEEKVKNLYKAMRGRERMQRTKRRRRRRLEGAEMETKSGGKCAGNTTNEVHGARLKATQSRLPRLAGA